MKNDRHISNVSDIHQKGESFVKLPSVYDRVDFSGLPQNSLEETLNGFRIPRWRAALQVARASRSRPIISHLPVMTAAVATACKALWASAPHVAFAFNFTDLPTGKRLSYYKRALASVTNFCMFAQYERNLYPEYFSLDPARFESILWTQDPPSLAPVPSPYVPTRKTYVSAIGGEGRDYRNLMQAAALLPHTRFVVVARPTNDFGAILNNVTVVYNIPAPEAWRIAHDSTALIVPLKAKTTCCGHITVVSAQQLGIPIIMTSAYAMEEYKNSGSVRTYDAGDVVALADLIAQAHLHWEDRSAEAAADMDAVHDRYDRRNWSGVVRGFLDGHQT